MTNKSHPTRCATLAIAATLALGSTPLIAQDAAAPPPVSTAPVIVVPDIAPPSPAPTIVVPDVPEAAPVAAPAQPATRTVARPTTTSRAAAPRPAPAAAAPAPEPAPVDTTITEAVPADIAPVAAAPVEPLPEDNVTITEQSNDGNGTMAVILGVFAALALLAIGLFALRRKGPKRYASAVPTIEKPVVARTPAALPEDISAPEIPGGLNPEPVRAHYTNPGAPFIAKPSGNLSHSGAAVALPRELPANYEERDALIQRMVNAAPDRANPFRSKQARTKRARLILASLDRDFKNTVPWIDLSQYPSNWPELARRQSAAA
jgi:hypothetical protein